MPFTLRSRRVVLPDAVRQASIHIDRESIARVADYVDVQANSWTWAIPSSCRVL